MVSMDIKLRSTYDYKQNAHCADDYTTSMGSLVLKFRSSSTTTKHAGTEHYNICACSSSKLGYLESAIGLNHICCAARTTGPIDLYFLVGMGHYTCPCSHTTAHNDCTGCSSGLNSQANDFSTHRYFHGCCS